MHPMPFLALLFLVQLMTSSSASQVKKFLIHGVIPSHTSCLCNISLEQAHMEVGIRL
jgi:hypothetical protein